MRNDGRSVAAAQRNNNGKHQPGSPIQAAKWFCLCAALLCILVPPDATFKLYRDDVFRMHPHADVAKLSHQSEPSTQADVAQLVEQLIRNQ